MDEKGYIKFQCNWIESSPVEEESIKEINSWRKKLFDLGLVGAYPNGIGYGNLSIRLAGNTFLITGTATGHLTELNPYHFVKVTSFNFDNNFLTCIGPIKASSESLTHAAVYECDNYVNAVIHVHHEKLWKNLIHQVPATSKSAEYGTPGMALEIKRLFKSTDVHDKKTIVMAGHESGIIIFGKSIDEAGSIILNYLSFIDHL